MPNETPNENEEEIDVTELIGRIETLEKENTEIKEKQIADRKLLNETWSKYQDLDESLDALIEKIKA